MKNTNIRNAKIDIIRALCIISIVMGHCGFPFFKFTCRFQTSLFFIISGYFWKVEKYSKRSIRDFTIHKMKTLWVPYLVWNGIFMLLNNFICKVGIYTTKAEVFSEVSKVASLYGIHEFYTFRKTIIEFLKILLFMGGTELGGASWFFRILFLAEMGVFVSFYILKKVDSNILLVVLIVISSFLGHALVYQQELIFGRTSFVIEQIGLIFFAYSLIVTGIMLKKLEYAYETFINTNKGEMFAIVVGLLVSCLMYYSKISIWQENYGVMVALFAWMFLWGQAYFIDRYLKFVRKSLMYLGKNTVPVFMGHFAVFKIVNIVVAKLEEYPFCYIAAFPTLGRWNPYGICYTVAGVIIPLFIAYMYNIFRRTYGLKDIN